MSTRPTRREYVAIIVPPTHPQMKAIIELFDEEVAMFQANKPQDI